MSLLDEALGKQSTDYVSMSVNGEKFSGFERGSIVLTMREGANTFDFEYLSEPDDTATAAGALQGLAETKRGIFEGDETEISIDAGDGPEVIFSGYVESVTEDDDENGLRLGATGMSRTTDLIACSVLSPKRWTNASLEKIALDICLPLGVDVYIDGDQGAKFPNFSVPSDERAFDAIARAALRRGMFPYCVGGDLILARAGETQTTTVLERGDRVIRSSRSGSWLNRYSDYVFKAQARSTDNNFGAKASQLKHTIYDETITRYRPLIVQADAHDGLDLKARAQLECNQRAGNGEQVVALVDGWHTDEGPAWRPNTLVRFKNKVLGVDADMLIVSVRFQFGPNEAREAELQLMRPEAFDVAKYPALARGDSWD